MTWSWDAFLDQALKMGIPASEFWDMTPAETRLALEAASWRRAQALEQDVRMAWLTAALVRAKRMPQVDRLLAARPARPLRGEEADRRRSEFKNLAGKVDVTVLNRSLRHAQGPGKGTE